MKPAPRSTILQAWQAWRAGAPIFRMLRHAVWLAFTTYVWRLPQSLRENRAILSGIGHTVSIRSETEVVFIEETFKGKLVFTRECITEDSWRCMVVDWAARARGNHVSRIIEAEALVHALLPGAENKQYLRPMCEKEVEQ